MRKLFLLLQRHTVQLYFRYLGGLHHNQEHNLFNVNKRFAGNTIMIWPSARSQHSLPTGARPAGDGLFTIGTAIGLQGRHERPDV